MSRYLKVLEASRYLKVLSWPPFPSFRRRVRVSTQVAALDRQQLRRERRVEKVAHYGKRALGRALRGWLWCYEVRRCAVRRVRVSRVP